MLEHIMRGKTEDRVSLASRKDDGRSFCDIHPHNGNM